MSAAWAGLSATGEAKEYRDPDAEDADYDLVGTLALATLAALNSF